MKADTVLKKYEKSDLNTRLMTDFREAMNNDVFSKLVSKVKLPYEELAKYTSLLEDSSLEYENCLKCKNLMECKNNICGHAFLPDVKDLKLTFLYKPCKYMIKKEKEEVYLKNVYTSNEPSYITHASFKEIDLKDKTRLPVIAALTKFIEDYRNNKNPKGIYLHGSFGSGKSYLVSALFNELAKDGVKSCIIFWQEFLTELKGSFGSTDFNLKLDRLKKTKLLLIDDIGAENVTSWSRDDVLCPILQYRMQEELPTFFTSNFTLDELENHFSITKDGVEIVKAKRLMERIRQLTVDMELNSKNLRK